MTPFSDPAVVASYAEATPKKVPGLADLHRMAAILMAERASDNAEILVVGAGGGLELKAFAEAEPGWRFLGVDPSAGMLDLARHTLGPLASRADLRQGYVEDAPEGPFDGATCLLTLHFLDRDERLRTLAEIHRRLRPGAALVVAHHSAAEGADLTRWLARSLTFAGTTANPDAAATMAERLPVLTAEEDEALLREAGFYEIALFYAAFSFRGWVAVA
ncbi:methyltransferase [Pleomorphomonas diazotrophica]|uniref:Methyltransferase n=1 Tax=Pleomorphomonas diazotrophica TaxID=1166257 RepID=A0A1I4V990_9HYPH|nr:class I SAM-dependent methyltransferase [Pleomorphomonas diazotrophica]PKR87340.1 methyltransferase [Pleomorphomonas diazotrophica]SFM97766.1 tRNA (cmo5U34)-methyltransferase [Pleomorphomonas diazotrophica]